MLISRNREKAFNAITYFTQHTNSCFKKKLYKLLYLLDFEHFQQTGRSVTGFSYAAWKMGPVPVELHSQIDKNTEEFSEYFGVVKQKIGENEEGNDIESIFLASKKVFEPKCFSERQLELLEDIANRFAISTGKEMEEFTHRQDTPWDKVWDNGQGKQKEIPYEFALDDLEPVEKEIILNIADERRAFIENYK
jgi:uncharacterized phage-associated protein